MKKYIVTLIFMIACIIVLGQVQSPANIVVSEIHGNVLLHSGKQKLALTVGQKITTRDVLVLPAGATLVLLDPQERQLYTLRGLFSGSIKKYLIKNKNQCTKKTSEKYMNYLLSKVFERRPRSEAALEDDQATVFRDVENMLAPEDSLLLDSAENVPVPLDSIR